MIQYAVRRHLLDTPAVAAIVGDRMMPIPIPQEGELPCITYTVAATNEDSQEGDTDTLQMIRLQLDCWATSHKAVSELARAVRLALPTTTGPIGSGANRFEEVTIVPANVGTYLYEPETKRHRVLMEFRIWYPVEVAP